MSIEEKASALARYAGSLDDFELVEPDGGDYGHMGATITEAILQAGLRYDTVVLPRVKLLRERHPEARTTSGFILLADRVGLKELIRWKDSEKPARIMGLANFLKDKGVETEDGLREWLRDEGHLIELKTLRGVGDKTVDYLRILAGIDTGAIDRHVLKFLAGAGVEAASYGEARSVINHAADSLGVKRTVFDRSIWHYMADRKNGNKVCAIKKYREK